MIENINHNQGVDELANNISKSLSSMKNSGGVIHYYWTLGNYAEELIKMKLGNEGSNMPVDIESLAKNMDIEIRDKRLNSYLMQNIWNGDVTYIEEIQNVKALNRRIGQLAIRKDSYTNEVEKIIYTDESVPISAKRYAIANEITNYLLYLGENRDNETYDNYSIMPMCPTKLEELTIDIFSVFLLIPISQFFKTFKEFSDKCSEEQNVPIGTEEWIKYLSERAGISEYYTACGYQYLRSVAYWIYRAHCVEEEYTEKNTSKDEEKLFEYVKDNTKFFDKNKYEMLFQ